MLIDRNVGIDARKSNVFPVQVETLVKTCGPDEKFDASLRSFPSIDVISSCDQYPSRSFVVDALNEKDLDVWLWFRRALARSLDRDCH